MDNERKLGEIDGQDENLRDRNVTDSGSRLAGTKTRSEQGTIEQNSIEDAVETNPDADTATEDISNRSDLGVGE